MTKKKNCEEKNFLFLELEFVSFLNVMCNVHLVEWSVTTDFSLVDVICSEALQTAFPRRSDGPLVLHLSIDSIQK